MTDDTGKREADLGELFAWDERRRELLTVGHNLRRSLFIDVTVWGYAHRMYRDDAPKVFADIEARLAAELSEIEAKFRAVGVRPSEWTAPEEGEGE